MTSLYFVEPVTQLTRADVSVVVPTMNEASNIGRFLESLPGDVQLIVVDSSTDGTAEMVEALRPERTTVFRVRANIPMARQIGADAASTPWLLFTDADVTFSPGYFDRLTGTLLPADCGGLVGTKGSLDGFDRYHRWFVRGQGTLMALGIPAATGSNMLVKRQALQLAGGFDPELTVNEDTELMFRLSKAGWAIEFRPDLAVHSFDHRRLEAGIARKVVHGALRNTALYLGWFNRGVRRGDWGYWAGSVSGTR